MKTLKKIYKTENLLTFNPIVEINEDEIIQSTNNQDLIDFCNARKEYSDFCDSQESSGQQRKNQRKNARKRIFKNFTELHDKLHLDAFRKLREEKISQLRYEQVEIELTTKGMKNLGEIMSGIQLALNVGGISPQYYGLGLRGYKVL